LSGPGDQGAGGVPEPAVFDHPAIVQVVGHEAAQHPARCRSSPETTISQTEIALGSKLAEKIKRAFIHYLEETELDNLEQPDHEHHH